MKHHKNALVLNAAWQPIGKVCWQKAFVNVFKGRAKVVTYYDDTFKTSSGEEFIPAVIVSIEYTGQPKGKTSYSKRLVLQRDGYICQYCNKQLCKMTATIDHVLPRSRGGKSTFTNAVAACSPCNKRKADHLLKNSKVKLRKPPRVPYIHPLQGKIIDVEPEWEPHLKGVIKWVQPIPTTP